MSTLNLAGSGGTYALSDVDSSNELPNNISINDSTMDSLVVNVGAAVTGISFSGQSVTLQRPNGQSVISYSNPATNLTVVTPSGSNVPVTGSPPQTVTYTPAQGGQQPVPGTTGNDTFAISSSASTVTTAGKSHTTVTTIVTINSVQTTYTNDSTAPYTFTIDGLSGTNALTLQNSSANNWTASNWVVNGSTIGTTFTQSTTGFPTINVRNVDNVSLPSADAVTINCSAPGVSCPGISAIDVTAHNSKSAVVINAPVAVSNSIDISANTVFNRNTVVVNGGPSISVATNLSMTVNAHSGTVRIPSWLGTLSPSIDASAVDLSNNTNLGAFNLASIIGTTSLNLSNDHLVTLPTLPPNLTSLDLRYNNLHLADLNALNNVSSESQLSQLYLYGNPFIDANGNAAAPNWYALRGMLLRVDLAPVGLAQAEQGHGSIVQALSLLAA